MSNQALNEHKFINDINPTIKSTLSENQKQEVRTILQNHLPPAGGTQLINLHFSFWLIKRWHIVFKFGRMQIQSSGKKLEKWLRILLTLMFYVIINTGIVAAIMLLVYIF